MPVVLASTDLAVAWVPEPVFVLAQDAATARVFG